jgi:hypothetical protein
MMEAITANTADPTRTGAIQKCQTTATRLMAESVGRSTHEPGTRAPSFPTRPDRSIPPMSMMLFRAREED